MFKRAAEEGEKIVIKYVTSQGQLRAIVWDGRNVFDDKHRSVGEFLRTCSLQGAHLGYMDDEERHYAFYNKGICHVLKTRFLQSLKTSRSVEPFQDVEPLSEKHCVCIPYTWTETFGEKVPHPGDLDVWFLTFGGVTLKGCRIVTPASDKVGVGPRSYLWALAYGKAQVLKQKMNWLNPWRKDAFDFQNAKKVF